MERGHQTPSSIPPRQPARSLLIDLSPPFSPHLCRQLCTGLENVVAMVCSLSGQCKLPSLSICTLTSFPEILLPLQHVRGNYPRIQCAIEEIQRVFEDVHSSISNKVQDGCLGQALQDACVQFKRHTKTMMQTSGQWCQLEIVIFTSQGGNKLAKQIEKIAGSLDLENIKRIQLVTVTDDVPMMEDTGEPVGSQRSSNSETSSEGGELGSLVETLNIDSDSLSIQNFFNSWFKSTGTDREHLHISLPSPNSGGESVTLKCDLKERLLDPTLLQGLTFGMSIEEESSGSKPHPGGGNKSSYHVPVYKLHIYKQLPANALCESIIFGMPLIAQATSCWKIDWEELEENQQTFHALCQTLAEKDVVLLASAVMPNPLTSGPYQSAQVETPRPVASFVLLPAQSTLLVKSIAVNELMLPCDDVFQCEKPTEESKLKVLQALEQVEVCDMYNPLLQRSGLYEVLKNQHRKPGNNRQPRRKFNYNPCEEPQRPPVPRNIRLPDHRTNSKRFCPPGYIGPGLSKSKFPTEL